VRPQILLDEDHPEVRDFAAKQNASADTFLATEEAEQGMAEMSKKFRSAGGEVYLPKMG
jgi:phosphomethylpyrimidine synthase